jgi:hypothetical protein
MFWDYIAALIAVGTLGLIVGCFIAERRERKPKTYTSTSENEKVTGEYPTYLTPYVDDTLLLERMDREYFKRHKPHTMRRMMVDQAPPEQVLEMPGVELVGATVIYCPLCDTDSHKCAGCGEPTAHGVRDCGNAACSSNC